MKSGELSIVAGVYLLTLGYMVDSVEWTVAGGAILIFGVVLMCVEIIERMSEKPEPEPIKGLPPPDPKLRSMHRMH